MNRLHRVTFYPGPFLLGAGITVALYAFVPAQDGWRWSGS